MSSFSSRLRVCLKHQFNFLSFLVVIRSRDSCFFCFIPSPPAISCASCFDIILPRKEVMELKLKTDNIRTVMIDLEKRLPWDESQTNIWSPDGLATFDSYKSLGHDDFIYTVAKLIEGDYVNGKLCPANNTIGDIYIYSITWKGHEFLDNIRDPKVWAKTKSITNKFASVSVSFVSTVASQVIAKLIEDTMHLQ